MSSKRGMRTLRSWRRKGDTPSFLPIRGAKRGFGFPTLSLSEGLTRRRIYYLEPVGAYLRRSIRA